METPSSAHGRWQRLCGPVLSVVVVAAFLVGTPANASHMQTARERLASLERSIERQEAAIEEQHARVFAIEASLAKVRKTQRTTTSKLLNAQRRLVETRVAYDALREQLDDVARTVYQQGPLAPVEALLGATSLADLADRLVYLENMQSSNAAMANQVARQAARLRAKRNDLDSLAREQAAQAVRLETHQATLLAELLDQQQQLADLSAARTKAAKLVRLLSLSPDSGLTGAGTTFGHWAHLFLAKLGAPACPDNLVVVVAWEASEGTAAAYNPLATTHDFPGATDFNSVGVKNYPSLQAGLQATMDTLVFGATTWGYGAILSDLRSCAPAESTALSINASAWCRGCAGGAYVTGVVPLVEADYPRFAGR
jgi:peptidoglycan hydrolase CwlO-like protein